MKKILVERSIHCLDEFVNRNIVGTHTLLKAVKKQAPSYFKNHILTLDEVAQDSKL